MLSYACFNREVVNMPERDLLKKENNLTVIEKLSDQLISELIMFSEQKKSLARQIKSSKNCNEALSASLMTIKNAIDTFLKIARTR